MSVTFTFDGNSQDTMGVSLLDVQRPLIPPHAADLMNIRGRDAAWFTGHRVDPRHIICTIALVGVSENDYRAATRTLAYYLHRTEPKALAFSDETGYEYYAILANADWSNLAQAGVGTLDFVCPDPFLYSTSADGGSMSAGDNVITNDGTALCYPEFTIIPANDLTALSLTNVTTGQFLQLGDWVEADATETAGWQQEWWDTCSSLGSWGAGGSVDGGDTTGAVMSATSSSGGYFYVDTGDWGTNTSAWRGPCRRRSVTAMSDFRVEARVDIRGLTNATGRTEVYLRDSGGAAIGKIAARDSSTPGKPVRIDARAGTLSTGHYIFSGFTPPTNSAAYNIYYEGRLLIQRVGRIWTAACGLYNVTSKKWTYRYTRTWRDPSATLPDLEAVDVHIGTYGTTGTLSNHYFRSVGVDEYTSPSATQQPYIIKAGEEIIVDCAAAKVTKDGLPFMEELYIGSQFIPLVPGSNTINIATSDTLTSAAYAFTERWW